VRNGFDGGARMRVLLKRKGENRGKFFKRHGVGNKKRQILFLGGGCLNSGVYGPDSCK